MLNLLSYQATFLLIFYPGSQLIVNILFLEVTFTKQFTNNSKSDKKARTAFHNNNRTYNKKDTELPTLSR